MTIKITKESYLAAAEEVVKRHGEDHVCTLARYTIEGEGGVAEPMCIVGHILVELGVSAEVMEYMYPRSQLARVYLETLEEGGEIELPEKSSSDRSFIRTWSDLVQTAQDNHVPWGKALDHANHVMRYTKAEPKGKCSGDCPNC